MKLDQINRPAKQVFQCELEPHESLERASPAEMLKFNDEIDVTGLRIKIAASRRAEQLQPPNAILTTKRLDLRAVLFD